MSDTNSSSGYSKDLLPLYDDVPAIAPDVISRVAESIKEGT